MEGILPKNVHTALGSCDAEIRELPTWVARLTVNTRNTISGLSDLPATPSIMTVSPPGTPLYNENDACVKWCHDMTTKGGNRRASKTRRTLYTRVGRPTPTALSSVSHICGKYNISENLHRRNASTAPISRPPPGLSHVSLQGLRISKASHPQRSRIPLIPLPLSRPRSGTLHLSSPPLLRPGML